MPDDITRINSDLEREARCLAAPGSARRTNDVDSSAHRGRLADRDRATHSDSPAGARGPRRGRTTRRFAALGASALLGVALLTFTTAEDVSAVAARTAPAQAAQPVRAVRSTKPTVVLVHGAFADASGWQAEIRYLQRRGYPVLAPANPLRGLTSDSAYLRSILDSIPGPVVLVGHSYGGAVITNAAAGAPNVKALVYVSAFVPAPGESVAQFTDPVTYPGSLLVQHLTIRPVANPAAPPAPDGNPLNDADAYIDTAYFRPVFAGDLSKHKSAVLAASQRPLSYFADTEKSGPAAWTTTPCWDLVSLEDKAIPPAAQGFMAHRACTHVVKIHSAHDSLISHPKVVDRLILQAVARIN